MVNRGTYVPLYDTDFEGLIGLKPPEKVEKKVAQPKEQKPKVVSNIMYVTKL